MLQAIPSSNRDPFAAPHRLPRLSLLRYIYSFFLGCARTVFGALLLTDTSMRSFAREDTICAGLCERKEQAVLWLVSGCCLWFPSLVVGVNRHYIFGLVARLFESSQRCADGSYIAALLDGNDTGVGDTWWVHREVPDKINFGEMDHWRYWERGIVTHKFQKILTVQVCLGHRVPCRPRLHLRSLPPPPPPRPNPFPDPAATAAQATGGTAKREPPTECVHAGQQ